MLNTEIVETKIVARLIDEGPDSPTLKLSSIYLGAATPKISLA